jgi:hypothetical protein
MFMREADDAPVIVLGRPTELADTVVASFGHHGIQVLLADTPAGGTAQLPDEAADSVLFVLDEDLADTLFGSHLPSARKWTRTYQNSACDSLVAMALRTGPRRLLFVCDTRQLSAGQRSRALRWVRDLLHRISYECAINGLHDLFTRYAFIDTDDDVHRTAEFGVAWHLPSALAR